MLTGPTPTLTNWITYRPGVEPVPVRWRFHWGRSFTVPSTWAAGVNHSELVRHVGIGLRDDREPQRVRGTLRFWRSDWPLARALVLVEVVPGPADAWVLEVLFVTQILST